MFSSGKAEPKRFLRLYLAGQMQKEMTHYKGPVHYNKWFNNLEMLATIFKLVKNKDEDVKKLPTGPLGQNLLSSKCNRLKAWMLKAFSNHNHPVIL